MSKFKVGDVVTCVNIETSVGLLGINKEYIISSVDSNLVQLLGVEGEWSAVRFELVYQVDSQQNNELLETQVKLQSALKVIDKLQEQVDTYKQFITKLLKET